jgi:hypothetical protein
VVERNGYGVMGTEPERAVALANYDCRVAVDYLARLTEIKVSLDNEFIATHGDALQRLKDSQ